MNRTLSVYNASSIMMGLSLRKDVDHVNMSVSTYYTEINLFLELGDVNARNIQHELEEAVTKNCNFEIKDFECDDDATSFRLLKITWNYND